MLIHPWGDPCSHPLFDAHHCRTQFGRDLLAGIDPNAPTFLSDYRLPDGSHLIWVTPSVSRNVFSEPESLFFVE